MGTTQMTTMKAVTQREYGPPEQMALEELPVPAIGEDEVLVRVHAAGVDPGVWLFVTGEPRILRAAGGLRPPQRARPRRWLFRAGRAAHPARRRRPAPAQAGDPGPRAGGAGGGGRSGG